MTAGDRSLRYHVCRREESWWEHDARGIPLCRVCEVCRSAKLSRYRPEVLSDPGYQADEPIEEE